MCLGNLVSSLKVARVFINRYIFWRCILGSGNSHFPPVVIICGGIVCMLKQKGFNFDEFNLEVNPFTT